MFNNFIKRILFILIIGLVLNTLTLRSEELSKLPDGVSIYRLDNGLQVLLIQKPTLPMIGVNTIVKVGSAYESFKTSGMSHMLEHLLFNGTTTMTQKELYDSTDIIGGYNNAHTGEYFTNFMMVTPSENIADGMKLQAAMLFDSVIPEEKFEKEKGIVLEEIAKSLGKSSEQLERNIKSIIYEGHALSLPTLGTYSTIENMNRDEVFQYYKNFYVPNNMIINIIGNFDTDEMLENIEKIYGIIEPGDIKETGTDLLAIGFNKSNISNISKGFHRFYDGENTHLDLYFDLKRVNNPAFSEVLQISLDIVKEKLKDSLNSKYNDSIKSLDFSIRETPIQNYIEANITLADDSNIGKIKNTFIELLGKEKLDLTESTAENESIKSRTRFLQNIEKPHMFGIYNADLFAEHGIERILASYSGDSYLTALNLLREYNFPSEYITILQHPKVEDVSSENSSLSKAILFESERGSPTVIAEEDAGSDLLAIHYLIKNKSDFEKQFGKDAAKIWHETFGERMQSSEIHAKSSQFGFSFTVNDNPYIPMDNIYLSPEFGYIRVEGIADDVKGAIEFLNSQMSTFIPTEEEYNQAIGKSQKPMMMGHGNKAKSIFDEKLEEVLYEKNNDKKDLPELSYSNLLEFGKNYFVPTNMIISVVSPEKNENIKEYFSSFRGDGIIDKSLGFIKKFKVVEAPEKVEIEGGGEQSYLYYGFQKKIDESEKAQLKVLSLLLSDDIVFDIREKQGMAYRMSAGIDIIGDKAMFNINMGTRPDNVDKLIPQFPKFFTEEFKNQLTERSIKKAVNMYLGRMMFRRLSSINQAYYMGHSLYFYDDINYDSKSLNDLTKVTLDDVKTMISKYMKVENPIEIYVR